MSRKDTARAARVRRHSRVRKHIKGTRERPRLSIYRSVNHIYAQVIDDTTGRTLAAASDLESEIRSKASGKRKSEVAALVGGLVAKRAAEKGVKAVVFDRGGFRYHGRIKALAEAAREAKLEF